MQQEANREAECLVIVCQHLGLPFSESGPCDDPQAYDRELSALINHSPIIRARPLEEWHEDMGPVLCCFFPIQEAPYCGSPLDTDFPDWMTHFVPLPDFNRVVPK